MLVGCFLVGSMVGVGGVSNGNKGNIMGFGDLVAWRCRDVCKLR